MTGAGQDAASRVEVEGEVFDVVTRRDKPGQYDCVWLTGPNRGYGFGSQTSDGRELSSAHIEARLVRHVLDSR